MAVHLETDPRHFSRRGRGGPGGGPGGGAIARPASRAEKWEDERLGKVLSSGGGSKGQTMTNSVARELRLREQREANRRSKQRAVDLGGGYGRGPAPLKSASQKSAEPSAEELEAFYREVGPELEF